MESEGHDNVDGADMEETVADTAESLLAFENAALPLGVLDPAGRIVLANRALRRLLGYELDELVGKSVQDLVVADGADVDEQWQRRVDSDARATPERRLRLWRKDGSLLRVRASSVSVPDSQGAIRYLVARAVVDL
ncbi:MAG: PAS domain S-box protein [Actinobacteria bacterium]|nr:MAG: PAS domain S-box protein [Actinomycetota bacterium]